MFNVFRMVYSVYTSYTLHYYLFNHLKVRRGRYRPNEKDGGERKVNMGE